MKRQIYFFRGILLLGIIFFLSYTPNVFSDTLKIHYYNDFSEFANLDSKYSQPDKYLVYKYASFTNTDSSINYVDVTLRFKVDKNWYQKNRVEDVIFLRYSNGNWTRINYSAKTDAGNYLYYQVHSNELGEYWAIIGVLPNADNTVSDDIILKNKNKLKKINQTGITSIQTGTDNQKFGQLFEDAKQVAITLKEPAKVKGASVISATTATLSLATLIALLSGPTNFFIVLKQLILAIAGLFSNKKKLRGGIVYDANTGKPIPLVRVDIIDKKTDKVKTTKFTNKEGRYYFLVPQGEYIVEAKKPRYRIVDISDINFVKALLHKEDIFKKIKLDKPGVIRKNIALLRKDRRIYSQGVFVEFLKNSLEYIAITLFVIGLVLNLWSCYVDPNFLNFSMLGVYILVILFRWMFINQEKYGIITNIDGKPEAFATINVFDFNNNKLITRAVTDTKGRYYITLDKGKYLLEIKTNNGVVIKKIIKVLDKNILSKKIIIKN